MNFMLKHVSVEGMGYKLGVMNVSDLTVEQVNQAMAMFKARGWEAYINGNHSEGFYLNVRVRVYGRNVSKGTDG